MDWIECESLPLDCPDFADVFEGREALEPLEAAAIIVGVDQVVEVRFELSVAVLMTAFYGCLLDRAVLPFDLAVGPRMPDLDEAMLDAARSPAHIEHVGDVADSGLISISRWEGELDAVVGHDAWAWEGTAAI